MTAATGPGSFSPSPTNRRSARRARPAYPSARLRLLLVALLLPSLLGGAFLTLTPTASAAAFTFNVNSTTDAVDATPGDTNCATAGAVCSLRAAIQEANALALADATNTITINLEAGTTHVLTLLNAPNTPEGAAATGDLDVKANVTINGNGATVNGNSTVETTPPTQRDRVFQVFSGFVVAFNNLTITGGSAYVSDTCPSPFCFFNQGSGILNQDFEGDLAEVPPPIPGGSLTLTDCIVDANGAPFGISISGDVDGGGVYNGVGRALNVTGTIVSNNAGASGGGLFNAGTATISGSTFQANFGFGITGQLVPVGGGGIGNTGALTLTNSRLINNSALLGGGISAAGFTESPPTRGVSAAAIATTTITDTEISGNNALLFGGGIANFTEFFLFGSGLNPDLSTATMQVTGGTITNNTAAGFGFLEAIGGGGGGVANGGTMSLSGLTIDNNTASTYGTGEFSNAAGGGVFNVGILDIVGSALTGNSATGVGLGGAIANGLVDRCFCSAPGFSPGGGPTPAAVGTALSVTNATISGNIAPNGGGAIYNVDESAVTLNHVTVANNQSGILNSQEISTPQPSPTAQAATVSVQNSILAANTNYNCSGAIANGGNNIDRLTTCNFGSNSNSLSDTDPLLGPLAVNAPGTTATHALLAGSPAIDRVPTGECATVTTDQRGVARPQDDPAAPGAGCDSGAYEFVPPAPSPSPSPSPSPLTHTVTLSTDGSGTVNPTPGTYTYQAGTTQPFTATANAGSVFIGWTVDDVFVGFGVPLALPVTKDRTVVATFAAIPAFCDVTTATQYYTAIANLAARGIIRGSDNPNGSGKCFRPGDAIIRAETAGLIARAFGWDEEAHSNPFPDRCDPTNPQHCIDDELWNDVAALAFYGVALGFPTNEFRPYDPVVHAQVVSFVVRAFNYIDGDQPEWNTIDVDNPAIYPGVPAASGHRLDLVTYATNAGLVPGTTATSDPYDDPATGYAANASRAFVAQTLWLAYSYYYSINRIP